MCIRDSLEPLNETWETLHSLLTEKGVLIVAVPNCSSFDAKKYGAYWAAYDVPRHLWHFTPGTIQVDVEFSEEAWDTRNTLMPFFASALKIR